MPHMRKKNKHNKAIKKADFDRQSENIESARRILNTVKRQVAAYEFALGKIRLLREELVLDPELSKRIKSSPEEMLKILESRGIASPISSGMVAEEFQTTDFTGGAASVWTWDCCCSDCCFTSCVGSIIVIGDIDIKANVPDDDDNGSDTDTD